MMGQLDDAPRVTFALFAYNQEAYVREAVEAALAQDYPNLEVILSDDSSTDRTWQVIRECAESYRGPHTIVLNRNECNLGIIPHVRKIASLGTGRYFVMAAGDDVSFPQRTSRCMQAFRRVPSAYACFSEVSRIDAGGAAMEGEPRIWQNGRAVTLDAIVGNAGGVGIGASYTYRMECFDWPWPLPDGLVSEDKLLPLRAALLGEVLHIDAKLVKYRVTGSSVTDELNRTGMRARGRPGHLAELRLTLQFACQQGHLAYAKWRDYERVLAMLPLFNWLDIRTGRWPKLPRRIAYFLVRSLVDWRTLPRWMLGRVRNSTAN